MLTLPSLGTCRRISQSLRTCVISSQTPHFPRPENHATSGQSPLILTLGQWPLQPTVETSVCTALFSVSIHHWRFSSKKILVLRQHCSERQHQQSHEGVLSNRPTLISRSISWVFTWIPELHFPATCHLLRPSSWVISSQVTWDFPTSYTAASTGRLHTAWPPGMPVWLSHFLASNPPVRSQGLRIKSKGRAWPNHCFPLPHTPTPGPPPLHAHNADVS